MTTPHYLDHILNGAMVLDRDFTVMFWNHWLEIHSGITRSAITGHSIFEFFPDINQKMLSRKFRQIFTLNTPAFINADAEQYLLKIPSRKMTGKVFDFMLQNVVISVYDKDAEYVLFMIYDQTSLYEARASLEESTRQLEEQHLMLQNTLDFQSNIIFVIEKNNIVNCNNNFYETFGYDTKDSINSGEKNLISLFRTNGDISFSSFDEFIDLSLSESSLNRIYITNQTSGREEVFLFSARRFPENRDMVIISMTDITLLENREKVLQDINLELSHKYDEKNIELVKVNKALTRSSNQLQLAQELANVGSMELDLSDNSIYLSKGFMTIFDNLSMEITELADINRYFTDEYKTAVKDYVKEHLASRENFSTYAEIISNAGVRKPLSIHGKFFIKVPGESKLLITLQDITGIKKLEKQISDKEQLIASIFDVADIGFLILGPDKKVFRINREFSKMTGYKDSEIIGSDTSFLNITSHKSDFEKYVKSSGETVSEICLKHKDGSEVYAYMNVSSYSLGKGSEYTVYALTDITDRIHLLNEQKEQEQLLIQQSKMAAMGEMIGVIAHQWKQPLNSLNLILDNINTTIADGEGTPEDIESMINICFSQIAFMSETIDDFRQFFSHDSAQKRFSITESITGTVKLLTPLVSKNGTKISIDNKIDKDVFSYGIPNEFSHTIMNILSNAKDAIASKVEKNRKYLGFIKISIECLDGNIVINICDNGGGIPENALEHMFDPYFTTKGDKGTGIGMYLARLIINKKMKGNISASNKEEGACLTITLPSV